MSTRYIISSEVEFWPENHQLVLRGARDLVITLHIPASRCLQLLIERRYSLVQQRDFYSYVWGDEGVTVSASTLYQNIALLRKALKSTGEGNKDLVVTVYRKGFRLNDKFSVTEQRDDEKVETTAFNELPAVSDMDNSAVSQTTAKPEIGNRTKFKMNGVTAVIVMLMILLGMQIYNWGYASNSSVISKFIKISAESGCVFFAEMNATDVLGKLKSINATDIDCHRTPFVYVSGNTNNTKTSFLACDREINSIRTPECSAGNILNGEGE
ncbi:winged helix-turn-helix domain-containing protein [Serratia fonticola]|uniref:winged helix-turn-helix domain-containing protein n=1 Tax=Serratia fonticola TaxID=47917 RepID=UPI00217814F4|nr:winged helix-turn-helix domain-containing protein [Serratia fonticola]CAI1604293.1 Transcriptional regulatory protein, C terminal [Serratia fonticola]